MTWKTQTILRHIMTHKPLLVIRSTPKATWVVDLEQRDRPRDAKILTEFDYPDYIDESKLSTKEKKGELEWHQAITI